MYALLHPLNEEHTRCQCVCEQQGAPSSAPFRREISFLRQPTTSSTRSLVRRPLSHPLVVRVSPCLSTLLRFLPRISTLLQCSSVVSCTSSLPYTDQYPYSVRYMYQGYPLLRLRLTARPALIRMFAGGTAYVRARPSSPLRPLSYIATLRNYRKNSAVQ